MDNLINPINSDHDIIEESPVLRDFALELQESSARMKAKLAVLAANQAKLDAAFAELMAVIAPYRRG